MCNAQISRNLHNHRLHVHALSKHHAIEQIHGLGKDDLLIYGIARNSRTENLLEGEQDFQIARPRYICIVAGPAGQSFECKAEEDEEKGRGLFAIIDLTLTAMLPVGDWLIRPGLVSLAVEGVKDKVAVFVNQARNGIDEVEPRILVKLSEV